MRIIKKSKEDLLLLRQKIGIPRIHFEQLVHILETALCVPDLLIDLFQSRGEFCGIAVYFDCDSLREPAILAVYRLRYETNFYKKD